MESIVNAYDHPNKHYNNIDSDMSNVSMYYERLEVNQ